MLRDAEEGKDRRSKIGWWLKWIVAARDNDAAKRHRLDTNAAYEQYEYSFKRGEGERTKAGYPIYKVCCDKLETALYAQSPVPRSRRKHGIDDPVALTMALINDRLCQHLIDEGHFDEGMCAARSDFIHGAKATTQVVYSATAETYRVPLQVQMPEVVEGEEVDETKATYYEKSPEKPYEGEVLKDDEGYFYNGTRAQEGSKTITLAGSSNEDTLHTPDAKTQSEITEMAYKFCIEYDKAEALFNPKKDKTLPYKTSKTYKREEDEGKSEDEKAQLPGRVLEGWECYCLHSRKKYWVCEEYKEDFLLVEDDPEGFRKFFPSPAYIITNKHRKNMYPTPAWVYLEGTANQLNVLWERIFRLIDGVRRRCLVYGASTELITALNTLDDQEYISAGSMQDILEKGGIDKMLNWVNVQELVQALTEAMQLEEHFSNRFSEWFHLPDILRGVSDPTETAAAQEIKSAEAHDTFRYMKKQMTDLARDSAELMLDMAYQVLSNEEIASIIGYEYLQKGTPGTPPTPPGPPDEQNPEGTPGDPGEPPVPGHYERFPEALARLRNDKERLVRIDFETDSTSFKDEAREMARMQMVSQTVLEGMKTITGIENPANYNIALTTLLGVLESMGGSSKMEDLIKKASSDLEKAKNQPPPPPPPDYEAMKVQVQQMKVQMDGQLNQLKMQVEGRKLQQKDQEIQLKGLETQNEVQISQFTAKNEAALERALLQLEAMRVSNEQALVQIENFRAQVQAQETLLEEIRLRQEADAGLVESATARAEALPPNPPPPIVISSPPVNVNVELPKPGKRKGKITRPDGSVVELETEDAPEMASPMLPGV